MKKIKEMHFKTSLLNVTRAVGYIDVRNDIFPNYIIVKPSKHQCLQIVPTMNMRNA